MRGTPPPPPPPDAGELDEEIAEGDRLAFREKLALHSRKKRCQSCHARIDPSGFAPQRYDHFGQSRSNRDDRAVLADGAKFRGLKGLQKYLLTDQRELVLRQLTRTAGQLG